MKGNTWLSNDGTHQECQQLGGMIMPVPGNKGLEGCKEECNAKSECDAFEWAHKNPANHTVDCCFLVACGGSAPEPMVTQAPHHGGTWMYKGYIKGKI